MNGGWEIAKRLLQYERQNISGRASARAASAGGAAGDLASIAKQYVGDETGDSPTPTCARRITENKMDFQAPAPDHRALGGREPKAGNGPSAGHLDHQVRRRRASPRSAPS